MEIPDGGEIRDRKSSFWGRSEYHDITFGFPDSGKKVQANKTVLALMSPVFNAMFFGPLSEKKDPVIIPDIKAEVFSDFLQALYTEEVKLKDGKHAERLFYAANKYEVRFIENVCKAFLVKSYQKSKLEDLRAFGEMYALKDVTDLCEFLANNVPNRQQPAQWVKYEPGNPLPPGMNVMRFESSGFPVGIGRFSKKFGATTDVLPGEFSVRTRLVTSTHGGRTYEVAEGFELLCHGKLEWKKHNGLNRSLRRKAVEGGRANSHENWIGEKLFVGRVKLKEGEERFGKIHHTLYIAEGPHETPVEKDYFILVDQNIQVDEGQEPLGGRSLIEVEII